MLPARTVMGSLVLTTSQSLQGQQQIKPEADDDRMQPEQGGGGEMQVRADLWAQPPRFAPDTRRNAEVRSRPPQRGIGTVLIKIIVQLEAIHYAYIWLLEAWMIALLCRPHAGSAYFEGEIDVSIVAADDRRCPRRD